MTKSILSGKESFSDQPKFSSFVPKRVKANLRDKIFATTSNSENSSNSSYRPISHGQSTGKIECFATIDPHLLNQYYELRYNAYSKEWGFDAFQNAENVFDRQGKIFVAVNENNEVVGGLRLMFSDRCDHLSSEYPGTEYTYINVIPSYERRTGLIFGEMSSVVVKNGNRDCDTTKQLFKAFADAAEEHGCHFACGVTVFSVCRNDKRVAERLGYEVEIVTRMLWKKNEMFGSLPMFPLYAKLR